MKNKIKDDIGKAYSLEWSFVFLCESLFKHFNRGGQRYFFGGALSLESYLFLRPLALDRNDLKFASALSAIPLGAIPPPPQIIEKL